MKLAQAFNKIKMNLYKQSIIILENSNLLRRTLDILKIKNYVGNYSVSEDNRKIYLEGYGQNIKKIKGYSPFLKYNNKKLKTLIFTTLTKNSGVYLISCNKTPYVIDHVKAIEDNIGGVVIGYVE